MNLRSGVHPVLAYFESTLVGRLFSLKVVIFRFPIIFMVCVPRWLKKEAEEYKYSLEGLHRPPADVQHLCNLRLRQRYYLYMSNR